jgi:mono/diheme cytochrome c family protein
MAPQLRAILTATFVLALVEIPSLSRAAEPPKPPLTFEANVRPILKAHCFQCHGEEPRPKGKLDLRLVRTMLKGGYSGEAIAAGNRDDSLLWDKVSADEMPPGNKKLTAAEKAILGDWINQGAHTSRAEPESLPVGPVFTDEERSFWSFQPVRRPDAPRIDAPVRVANTIDSFLLARLREKGLDFSPEADRRTLIRRASFDLRGLPPSVDEIDAFVADTSPTAYERLIDRFLASPQYGERWARHWLDIAGYADSDGEPGQDTVRPYAYKYRDYLIRALNADRPWDELIREQLAGDEMLAPPYQDLAANDQDKLIATGFLRSAPDTTAAPDVDAVQARDDVIAETIKVMSSSLLGLTVGCAQCHAHRYDPISQEDYFRIRALFEPAYNPSQWRPPGARLVSLWSEAERKRAAEVDAEVARVDVARGKRIEELVTKILERELEAAPADLRAKLRAARDVPEDKRNDEQKGLLKTYPRVLVSAGNVSLYDASAHGAITKEFNDKASALRNKRPPDNFAQALTEVPGQAPETHLLYRGDPKQPRHAIAAGELSLLAAITSAPTIAADDPQIPTTGRRLAYARHLTSGKHPLVARVLVNRVWMHHFGRGLVATPADFGALGERPSHPELLELLADEFVRGGWQLKPLHRLIMTSTAYRQSSRRDPKLDALDPDNRLLGRMSVRRLEAETVRDAILAGSGRLNTAMFGPPLPVAPDEAGQVLIGTDTRDSAGRQNGKPGSLGGAEYRRSIYIQVRRTLPLGFTESFDPPTLAPNCDRRAVSTVAPQSLSLMNNDFIVEQSEAFARSLESDAGTDATERVRLSWKRALGIEPSSDQIAFAIKFLADQRADFAVPTTPATADKAPKTAPADPERRALATYCQALFGSNAFLYVD